MVQDLFDLTGRTALVTGASSGIGRRQAQALAAAGANLVLVGRRAAALEASAAMARDLGRDAVCLARDLGTGDGLAALAREASAAGGGVDILVNAAGVNLRESVDQITLQSWRSTLDINLSVPFFLARELVPGMRERGWGRVINLASLQSIRAFENGLAYGASKGGVAQLTRAMAEAWSGYGITCNAIAPGFFPTELTRKVFEDPARVDRLAAQTAVGRNGRLEDLDGITVFLASAASDYVTGQVIYVDGGFTAK